MVPVIPIAPIIIIKDKPCDMGIKPITDKDSWTDAKKIIDAWLRRAPYWPRASKELVTTNANTAAIVLWWEDVISFYCQPLVSNLFVEDRYFDGRGFDMITHIDQHFNLLGVDDSLGYIFDLVEIRQSDKGWVVTLKTRISCLFSALKMGGINIDSALQVGFMQCSLLAKYQAVSQELCLGCHALTDVSLQMVVRYILTENFKYMLWFIADYWGFPVTNIALQGEGGVARTPSTPQVYYLYVLLSY